MVREKLSVSRKPFGFRLNIDMIRELKILAVRKDKGVNVLLEEAIQDLLKKYQKK